MTDILAQLTKTLNERKQADPAQSYTASLFAAGPGAILKKIGEEATEVVIAGQGGKKKEIVHEVADLWFHTLVLLAQHDLSHTDILRELEGRFGRSGLAEKSSRNN